MLNEARKMMNVCVVGKCNDDLPVQEKLQLSKVTM